MVEAEQDSSLVSPPSSSVRLDTTIAANDEVDDTVATPMVARRDDASCVQVAVRVRPIITLEGDDESCMQVLHQSTNSHATAIQVGGSSGPRFTFDHVFGIKSTQQDVYTTRVAPLVVSCLEGYNATILAYGQTGSGKTFTIMGADPTIAAASPQDTEVGVIPRAFAAIFQSLADKKEEQRHVGIELEYQVSVQFLELYGEEIRDLLATHRSNSNSNGTDKLFIRDLGTDEPEVVGATQLPVSSSSQALRCLAHGMLRRVTGATAMNESSSRSHAILTVCIEQSSTVIPGTLPTWTDGSDDCEDMNDDHVQMTRSKFNFVDLAGAERQKRTGASGKRLQEGIDINKGLSNLGNVISALGDPKKRGKTHVPYRDAKLTRLLKGSLGGNHKTLMIACVSPAAVNMGESLNCLRYANRAKNIQNKAVVNLDANSRLVQELQGQVRALASDLLRALDGETDGVQFERATLVSLASGSAGAVPMSPTPSKPERGASEVAARLRDTETELRKTRDKLRQTLNFQDAAELELHTVRAQNQLCDLQITALTKVTKGGAPVASKDMETAFMEKAAQYEGEIGNLQKALREAESKLNAKEWPLDGNDDDWLEKEKRTLQRDQDRLESIRAMSFDDVETQYHTACDSEQSYNSGHFNDRTEADEENQNSTVDALTKKFIEDHDDDDTENEAPIVEEPPARLLRTRKVAADLEELSHSIAMKEKLIEQIKRNKEREAMMRAFYENKLESLRSELEEKESERNALLKLADQQTVVSQELQDQLREKSEQIDALKSIQKSFKLQTNKTPRNEADVELLAQLKSDVTKMKKRKANMQKELAYEKRHHMKEVNTLNKVVVQKDRELNKAYKISNQRAVDAEKAKAMAKTRLEELAQLKKALRLYKQGVGLDPVMVGRRQARAKGLAGDERNSSKATTSIDVDSIRDYFDEKVACVVRREFRVDMLVRAWEEYFELHNRMREYLSETVEHNTADLETLEVEIRYKNDRIRKLARRVHKQDIPTQSNSTQDDSIQGDKFIFDGNFSKLCSGFSSELVQRASAKVLFGMIVRERRRVAALAKAASSLDERVQTVEKQISFSESALRSCMDDHRQEVADLEEKQQERLLTLINMVSEDSNLAARTSDDVEGSGATLSELKYQKMLLVLANERVAVLEDQLSEVSSHKTTADEYATQIVELKNLLVQKGSDCDALEQTRVELRTGLRLIRDEVSKHKTVLDSDLGTNIVGLVEIYLHSLSGDQCDSNQSAGTDFARPKAIRNTLSPRFKMQVELMNSSDSDSESDAEHPDDAQAAIQRLVHLAVGSSDMYHPSDAMVEQSGSEGASVFDRLANPTSFTGTQRRTRDNRRETDSSPDISLSMKSGTEQSGAKFKDNSIVAGHGAHTTHKLSSLGTADTSTNNGNGQPTYQSVFDRLGSPSQYTGTQKERYQDTRTKRDRGVDAVADKTPTVTPKGSDQHTDEKGAASAPTPTIRTDYTKLNVFDRLQNTTTQAAAIRQSETMHIDSRADSKSAQTGYSVGVDGYHSTEGVRVSPVSELTMHNHSPVENGGDKRHGVDRAAYVKQNVFDRLQTTTTLAAAVRQSETLHPDSRVHAEPRPQISPVAAGDKAVTKKPDVKRSASTNSSGSGSGRADYRKQNVFERLNKTTTETFAKKTHKTKSDDSAD